MKRFLIAVVLLFILAGIAAVTSFKAENLLENSREAMLSCTKKEKDSKMDSLKTGEAIRLWDKNKKILFMLSAHDNFSEIENKIAELRYYSVYPDFEKSSEICFELSVLFEEAKEDFYVTSENIF